MDSTYPVTGAPGRGLLVALLLAAAVAVCVAIAGATAPPASAHYYSESFTGSDSQYWYIPSNARKCLYDGGNDDLYGCIRHTYTFVSANDQADRAAVCAQTYNVYDHSRYSQHCGVDFVRHCVNGYYHDGNPYWCHDQDTNAYHAGAANGSSQGTTIGIHGTY